jgi:hypothetical protein
MPGFDIFFKNTNLFRGPIVQVANICTVSLDNSATLLTAVKHDDTVYPCFAVIINSVTCCNCHTFFNLSTPAVFDVLIFRNCPVHTVKKPVDIGWCRIERRGIRKIPNPVTFDFLESSLSRSEMEGPRTWVFAVHSQKYREMYLYTCQYTSIFYIIYMHALHILYSSK